MDLDHFKLVNDTHGHLVGSAVLREFGELIKGAVRSIDTLARYGGDEFTIVLVDTSHSYACSVAERIREMVQRHRFQEARELQPSLKLSLSLGVSSYPTHGRSREALLDASDKAMYLAKARGRNRVCSAGDLP
jgi:diguanylate cyclase (GGDEF)-like protein